MHVARLGHPLQGDEANCRHGDRATAAIWKASHKQKSKKNVDVQDRERELLVHKLHSIETHEIIGRVVMFQSLSDASTTSRRLVYSIVFRMCES